MSGPIDALYAGGFTDEQISVWAVERRAVLEHAGFKDNEIDAYFTGGVKAPDKVPEALDRRLAEGAEARKREGGLAQTLPQGAAMLMTPEGRGKLWEVAKAYPSEFVTSMLETLNVPGDVAQGKIDLSTEGGMDKAIGLGALIGFGRPSKLPMTGRTSGFSVANGDKVARIDRAPMGEIHENPIGGMPTAAEFSDAAKAIGGPEAPLHVQEKLLRLYEDEGRLPAEVAHDAQTDPVLAQRLLSKDPAEIPFIDEKLAEVGGEKPPPPPKEPPEPPAPGSFEDAQKNVLDKISIGEREPAQSPWTFRHIYTQLIDNLYPLKDVSTAAYELARLTRGAVGKASHFLEYGTFDFDSYKINGKGFREIVAPVRDDLNGLRAYLVARRALDLEGRGIKSGLAEGATEAPSAPPMILSGLDAARAVVDEGAKKYGQVARDLVDYQNNLLTYLKKSGMVSEKSFDAMVEANQNYVPFFRLIGGEAGGPKQGGKTFGPGDPLKKITGSERKVIDPLESIIKNTYAYISIADSNAVGIELVDALKKNGFEAEAGKVARSGDDAKLVDYLKEQGVSKPEEILDFIKRAVPEDGDTIGAFRNGVREEVKVNDPDLVDAFRGLNQESVPLLIKVLAAPAKTLRAGAVLTPEFMARNLLRDFITAFVNTGKGIFTPFDTAKGLSSVLRGDAHFQDWLKGGGGNATMVGMDRRYLQESLKKLTDDTGLMTRSWNVVTSPLSGLRMLSEIIENATRVGEFSKMMAGQEGKSAIQSAAFSSREVTLDFARMGARLRSYNMITAFANAQIQGVDRAVRAFADRPFNTTAKVAAGITLPSVLLWWANHDDQRVKELPDWQKDLFWIVPTDKWEQIAPHDAASKPAHLVRERNGKWEVNNGAIFRIPKPFELGVIFGSGPERILDATIGKNPEAFDNFGKSVIQALAPNFIPTAVQPMFEQWANRSAFTNRTLIPADVEKLLPEYQYTPYTTELAKKLGQIVSAFPGLRDQAVRQDATFGPQARGMSTPVLIENYIRSWTGGLGMYALNAADTALRKAGMLPDPITPTPTLADIPFVKGFVARYPSASAKSIQDFYDDHAANKKYFDTFMAKARDGDIVAMQHIQVMGGPMMFAQLDGIKETLSEHSKLVKDVYKNPQIPAPEKRQLIDQLYYSMIQIGQYGKQAIQQMRLQSDLMDAQTKATKPEYRPLTSVTPEGAPNGKSPH